MLTFLQASDLPDSPEGAEALAGDLRTVATDMSDFDMHTQVSLTARRMMYAAQGRGRMSHLSSMAVSTDRKTARRASISPKAGGGGAPAGSRRPSAEFREFMARDPLEDPEPEVESLKKARVRPKRRGPAGGMGSMLNADLPAAVLMCSSREDFAEGGGEALPPSGPSQRITEQHSPVASSPPVIRSPGGNFFFAALKVPPGSRSPTKHLFFLLICCNGELTAPEGQK